DLGTFVAEVEQALAERGHEVGLAVLDTRAGGKGRYLTLARRTLAAARPDVVYAHFLVPAGLIAAVGGRAPLVVTAHGRDVRNIGAIPGVAAATRLVVRQAATVICVSGYLQRELETKLPEAGGKVEVVSSGIGRERFAVTVPPPAGLLVDPLDVDGLARGLEQAAALPCPNQAARDATAEHDVRRQAERIEAILSRAAALSPRA